MQSINQDQLMLDELSQAQQAVEALEAQLQDAQLASIKADETLQISHEACIKADELQVKTLREQEALRQQLRQVTESSACKFEFEAMVEER